MGIFSDLLGSLRNTFKIGGTSGVQLKNLSGHLSIRNPADSADANLTANKVSASGDSIEINSDAASTAADWKYTLQRPTSGMAAALSITLPPDAGTANQVLQTNGSGVTNWASAASTASCDKIDTTSLAFGTASPLTMFSTGAQDIIDEIEVVLDTPFNGSSVMSIGIAGSTSKYMSTTDVDLTSPAGTVFKVHPGLPAAGVEALIATFVSGGATAGAARILVHFATPA